MGGCVSAGARAPEARHGARRCAAVPPLAAPILFAAALAAPPPPPPLGRVDSGPDMAQSAPLLPRGRRGRDAERADAPPRPQTAAAPGLDRKRLWALVCVTTVAAALAADQNVLAPSLSAAARDFGFDAAARDRYLGGYIAAAFFAVGAPAALLAGAAADRVDRVKLLALLVVVGEAPCLLTAFVTRYWHLLALRTLTGVSAGGVGPLAYSMVGDLAPQRVRAHAAAVVQLALGAGMAAGQGLAALVAPALGWRAPFVLVAPPALAAAALMLATVSDPPRGAAEDALAGVAGGGVAPPRGWRASASAAALVLRTPSAAAAVWQGLPGSMAWGVVIVFLVDYLAADRGLAPGLAAAVAVAWGAGGVPGVFLGGAVGQAAHNWRPGAMPAFAGVAVAAATGPALFLVLGPVAATPPPLLLTIATLGGALANVPGPNTRAVLLNVAPPGRRGVALAAQTVLDDVGRAAGPAAVAALAAAVGRRAAFAGAVCGWAACGAVFGAAAPWLARDERRMQAGLARAAGVGGGGDSREASPRPPPGGGG